MKKTHIKQLYLALLEIPNTEDSKDTQGTQNGSKEIS